MPRPSEEIEKLAGQMEVKMILKARTQMPEGAAMDQTDVQIIRLACMQEAILAFLDRMAEQE